MHKRARPELTDFTINETAVKNLKTNITLNSASPHAIAQGTLNALNLQYGGYYEFRLPQSFSIYRNRPCTIRAVGANIDFVRTNLMAQTDKILTEMVEGTSYRIRTAGNTDFTLLGARNSFVNTIFTYNGVTGPAIAGTGNVSELNVYTYLPSEIDVVTNIPVQGINFNGTAFPDSQMVQVELSLSNLGSGDRKVFEQFLTQSFRCQALPDSIHLSMSYTMRSDAETAEASAVPRIIRPNSVNLHLEIVFDEAE